MNNISFE